MTIPNQPKKNIIVCGYPKSGTIWATRLVAELLESPAVGYWRFGEPHSLTEGLSRVSSYNCFQSHHTHQELENDLNNGSIYRLIYLVRDPRDILISGRFHFAFQRPIILGIINGLPLPSGMKSYLKRFDQLTLSKAYKLDRMKTMLFEGDTQIPHCHSGWKQHIEGYKGRNNILFIRYEDLLAQGVQTSKKMLAFIGEPNETDEAITEAITKQSFAKRKAEFKNQKEKVKDRHLRKGISGDWKNQLDQENCDLLVEELGDTMKAFNYI